MPELRPPHFLLLAAALLVVALPTPDAQAQLSASASVSATTIGAGEMLLLTLEVEGDLSGLQEPEPPVTNNLALVQTTPQRRVELTIVNGRRTERTTLQWTYQPLGTGAARIGPIRVTADLGTLRTDPIQVRVVPQALRPPATHTAPPYGGSATRLPPLVAPESSGMAVRAEPSTSTPFVGQQVVVDYVLTYDPERFQPRESQLLGAWEAAGLWREEMDVPGGLSIPRPNAARTRYEVTIKRVAVFPARSGELQIEPITLEVGGTRMLPSGMGARSLFDVLRGGRRYVQERVEMPAVRLDARPLPDGAPDAFAGAVGRFQMEATLDPRRAADGQPVALDVELSGTGNVALLESPAVPLPDGVARYDVEERRKIYRGGAPLHGEKVFTHQLAAEHAGTFALPIAWSYFDPEAQAYRTLEAEPVLEVSGAAARPDAARAAPGAALPAIAWTPVRPGRPLHLRPWVWAGIALPLLALLGLVGARRWTDYQADLSPAARRRRAPAAAQSALADAREALLHDSRAGAARLDAAVRAFLRDRFGLSPGLPHPALDAALAERHVGPETRGRLLALLTACETAQFAPGLRPATPALVDEAADVLGALDATSADAPALP